jgi:acetyltransferase
MIDLTPVLRPRSIAVVGASPRTFVGRVALENSRALGYQGRLYPVNPKYQEIGGLPASPSLADLPEAPDVVLVQVGTDRIFDAVREGLAVGARSFVIPGAGYTDSGPFALELAAELRTLATERGVAVVGTNCMGFVDLVTGAAPYIGTVPMQVRRGRVGLVAQSGAIVEAFVNNGGRVPLSTIISCGSEAGTGLAEYLAFFALDEQTDAVLAFVEGFGDADAFLAAARAMAEAGKPLAVCKVGRSSAAQAGIVAHSGKLAGNARVGAAALRQAGAILCDDLDELTTIGEIFGAGRTRIGRRAHIVTNSGGEANLLSDLAEDVGIELPALSESGAAALGETWPNFHARNPMDPWGTDDYKAIYPRALRTLADEPGDLLIVSLDQQTSCGSYELQLGRDLAAYLASEASRSTKTPVFLSPSSQDPSPELLHYCVTERIPLLRGAWTALDALAKVARRTDWAGDGRIAAEGPPIALPELTAPGALDEMASLAIVNRYGIPTPRLAVAPGADAAVEAAERIGYPVVLKGVAGGISHKTELGLVRVGLGSPDEVRRAAAAISGNAARAGLTVTFIVAEHVRAELEVIAGFRRDDQFGVAILVGLGGIWAEHFDQVAVRIGRIGPDEARRMLDDTILGRMLRTARGGLIADGGIVAAIVGLAALGDDHPEIAEVDLNPILVGRERTVAVDALVVRADAPPADLGRERPTEEPAFEPASREVKNP